MDKTLITNRNLAGKEGSSAKMECVYVMRYFVSASFLVSCLICVIFALIGYLQTQFK
jgi:hypothetical protein